VSHSLKRAIHCINPNCPHPYPHTWENKYCNSCGSPLKLKNRYVALQQLGVGGFATLYTVWDLQKQTERVLKVLVEPSPKALELFAQEAAVLASLKNPGVPKVEPGGYFHVSLTMPQQRELPCLVMEKINGQTLEEILEQYPQGCHPEWVMSWLQQAVEILQELHSRRIIHRDLKPSNLMLRNNTGQLVMIDFGGAKQIGPVRERRVSSTRLFSSGYSPPEQIAGRPIGPAADFYALGRTMIQLLTGKYPPDLEDPVTGDLRWRHLTQISPAFADLLDDMVRTDVRQRPATAAVIQERLAKSQNVAQQVSWLELIQNSWNWSSLVLVSSTKAVSQTTRFVLGVTIQIARAGVDIIWEMMLGASGAFFGTVIGFGLTYWSPLGNAVANLLTHQLSLLVPNTQINISSPILLFALVGAGTAWGLTVAGGFGQRRRYLIAVLMGLVSYGLGWSIWQALAFNSGSQVIIGLIALATALLPLGLGLPSHQLIHSLVTATGCTLVFAAINAFELYPDNLGNLFLAATPGWQELLSAIAFFCFLSVTLGFWLGVSYYVVVPSLRFLRRR